jgi:TetR/AcrR family transcriptional regulator, transcriptional repressor for nem operon
MRYRTEHKANIHRKIVRDASRLIRREGLAGAAVGAVMRDAGLTQGGFYRHFESKEDLLIQSVGEAFRDIVDKLARVAEEASPGEEWRAIVETYLSLQSCADAEHGCPLTALGPELTRADLAMKSRVLDELVNYKDRMTPFMPGQRTSDKERAFFAIFSTMIGAVQIARMLPDNAARKMVLAGATEQLLHSFTFKQ